MQPRLYLILLTCTHRVRADTEHLNLWLLDCADSLGQVLNATTRVFYIDIF